MRSASMMSRCSCAKWVVNRRAAQRAAQGRRLVFRGRCAKVFNYRRALCPSEGEMRKKYEQNPSESPALGAFDRFNDELHGAAAAEFVDGRTISELGCLRNRFAPAEVNRVKALSTEHERELEVRVF